MIESKGYLLLVSLQCSQIVSVTVKIAIVLFCINAT